VVEQGQHEVLYENKCTYFEIFNAMANRLTIDKIAKTMSENDEV
jgi:hypothetical protein